MKVPDTGPKRKLLDATERLVVEKGFDLVSVRDITNSIKANVAAVNYHFGSREGLMDLVTLRVLEPLNEERLKALTTAGKKASVSDIVSAFVHPLLSAAGRHGKGVVFFLKLAGRVSVLPDAVLFPSLLAERISVSERFIDTLGKAAPAIRAAELVTVWRFFEAGLAQSLVGLREDADAPAQVEHWIALGTRGIGSDGARPEENDAQGMLFDF